MAHYELPITAEINGKDYEIRSDYRAALDVISVMNDAELHDQERAWLCLEIFYPDFDDMEQADWQPAIDFLYWFIGGGDKPAEKRKPKLIDWDQDFHLIVGPVNKVLGEEIRSVDYLHWWTFLSAYKEIGDCTFARVVSIRDKLRRGKKLDKPDAEFYKDNRDIVDLHHEPTEEELSIMAEWGGKK